MIEEVLYWVVVSLSAFALGATLFTAMLNARRQPWIGLARLGHVMIVGTLLWLIFPARAVEPSVYYWVYTAGLILSGIGGLGDTMRSIRISVERIDPNGTDPEEKP